jgi:hypothetical protein
VTPYYSSYDMEKSFPSCMCVRIIYTHIGERRENEKCVCYFSTHSRRHNYYTCPTSVRKHEKIRRVKGDILYKFIFQRSGWRRRSFHTDAWDTPLSSSRVRGNYYFNPLNSITRATRATLWWFFLYPKTISRACVRFQIMNADKGVN